MQPADTGYLGELDEDLKIAVLEAIPPEERLRGLTPEERLRGLTKQERERLRELLERDTEAGNASPDP